MVWRFTLGIVLSAFLLPWQSVCQQPAANGGDSEKQPKRILGIIPNYRTWPTMTEFAPLTRKEKFNLAFQDATDRGTFILGAAFAGVGQLTDANPSFGQGVAGYARYFGTAYGDLAIGDFMTEAIFPTVLHQDPRNFRRGTGSGWSRLGYAVGQIVRTHSDTGRTQWNYSEVIGNSAAVAISNAYYPDSRDATSAAFKLISQLGVDAAGNILKEFWPDLNRKLSRKRHDR